MKNLFGIWCTLRGKHAWRKARKSEDAASKYCKTCSERRLVKRRKLKSGPAGSGENAPVANSEKGA